MFSFTQPSAGWAQPRPFFLQMSTLHDVATKTRNGKENSHNFGQKTPAAKEAFQLLNAYFASAALSMRECFFMNITKVRKPHVNRISVMIILVTIRKLAAVSRP
jgi:hypothetical protein